MCTVIETTTVDRILSTIELTGGWARFAAPLSVAYLFDFDALGRAMLALNVEGYSDRDAQADDSEVEADIARYRWAGAYATTRQGYTALRRFLYQCEAEVTEDPLYLALSGYADHVAGLVADEAVELDLAA